MPINGRKIYRNFALRSMPYLMVGFIFGFALTFLEPKDNAPYPKDFLSRVTVELKEENLKGINPDLLLSMAILETGWGNGKVYQATHNLFSIKTPRKGRDNDIRSYMFYHNDNESIRDVVRLLSRRTRYQKAFQFAVEEKAEEFFRALQEAGYSTNPNYEKGLERVFKTLKHSKVSK